MRIEVDPNSGFCFGVVYAIAQAEFFLDQGIKVYCLGDIVHNDKEVERLKSKGLEIIDHNKLNQLKDAIVLIRAHGEPPETYQVARENDITLIDASCPIVLKLQNRIREVVRQAPSGAQIVIYGKPGHPEVIGLMGQIPDDSGVNKVLVTGKDDALQKIDFSRPIYLFSQTTKSIKTYYELGELIKEEAVKHGNTNVYFNDTICRQVSNRDVKIKEFARRFDIVLFVAGKKSSNGKVLFETAKSVNPNTYFISSVDEIDLRWLEKAESVGICGATSTPSWLMQRVKDFLERELNTHSV
ncbi:MAG: 4-hydroxy-3-methylbut-2-enyl diphosphate reductase [Chlorobi bacterium]|nr:4-hydroxy-3-methylbut-2-enyl diphosphate reductase [Chlorobiota bacterium]